MWETGKNFIGPHNIALEESGLEKKFLKCAHLGRMNLSALSFRRFQLQILKEESLKSGAVYSPIQRERSTEKQNLG